MKKLTAALVMLTTQAMAADWWVLTHPAETSSFSTNAFTICKLYGSPAKEYEAQRDKGLSPTIKENGDKVIVEWAVRDPVTGLHTGDGLRVSYFRTKDSCEKEAQARRAEAEADKELGKYR
jgi:hypothetical protein